MLKRIVQKCVVLTLMWALVACSDPYEDTCSGGDNMGNPRLADGFDPRASTPELRLLWDRGTGRGAELPSSYFDRVSVSAKGMSRQLVESATHVAEREILVRVSAMALAEHLDDNAELSFALDFPDRRGALACHHPGIGDYYAVEITLTLRQGVLVGSRIEQAAHYGAI